MLWLRSLLQRAARSRHVHWRCALLLVTLIIVSRKPILLVEPRLWWDEGMVNLSFAYTHGLWATLTSPHQGYFSLINNITALAQRLFMRVEDAPFISTYMAFAVQLLPHFIIWRGKSPYWAASEQRILASLIVLFSGAHCVLWLNVVTAQFHLSLVTFLILMENWQGRSRRCERGYAALLLLAGMSGVVSCLLLPFFWLRWRQERSRFAAVMAASLGAATLVALWGVANFFLSGQRMLAREQRFGFSVVGFVQKFARGTVGNLFLPSADELEQWQPLNAAAALGALAAICGGFAGGVAPQARVYFLGAFFWLAGGSLLLSLNFSGQARYFYAANTVLMLLVMQNVFAPSQARAKAAGGVLLLALLAGMHDFYFRYECYHPQWPKWRDEVALWRQDPDYPMRQHPRGTNVDWRVRLPYTAR